MCCLGWSLWSKSDSHGPVVSWEREGYFTNPFSLLFLLPLILHKTHQLVHPPSLFPSLPSLCSPLPILPSFLPLHPFPSSLASNSHSSYWSQARPARLAICFLRGCCVWLLTHFSGLLTLCCVKALWPASCFQCLSCLCAASCRALLVCPMSFDWHGNQMCPMWGAGGSSCFTSRCQIQIPKVWVFFKI